MQDFTGVPAIVDLAAMRDAMDELGGDPESINPLVPVELVIDHSIQVDVFAERLAFQRNAELEFERNRERYAFLRWGKTAFENFAVVPPNTGICHQVNLEYLARVVETPRRAGVPRHAGGHRLPHHDGQRPRRARLGGGRHRGGGRDARPAGVDADPAGRGLPARGRAARGLHRHGPGAHRHPDAARARRGGQVRGVLRPGPAQPAARRPRHDREHGPRDGRHLRDLPGRRARRSATSSSPAARRSGWSWWRPTAASRGCSTTRTPRRSPTATRSRSTSRRSSPRWPARAGRRTGWRSATPPPTSAPSSAS